MDVSTGNKHHPSFVTMDRGAGGPSELHAHRKPSREEMHAVFGMCRQNQWTSVLNCVRSNPWISVTSMIMDNHISTTILHQAITSKGDTKARARVIREILALAPDAAAIKNGYGSLPLHVIAQRNTKMDAATKELLINELVVAYKDALAEEGGVGKRTPLHIIFTDYISPRLTKMMIEHGQQACFKRDKKGYLPAHVACSRHCSPEKLLMLLTSNPDSLTSRTNDGHSLLSLAMSTATKSHPNYALIEVLKRSLENAVTGVPFSTSILQDPFPAQVSWDDINDTRPDSPPKPQVTPPAKKKSRRRLGGNTRIQAAVRSPRANSVVCSSSSTIVSSMESPPIALRTPKRKAMVDDIAASLLLHFSRQNTPGEEKKMRIAAV